jgi:hypothetical protein
MSDALGAALQPPRPPGASAEAGAGGQRPLQQGLLQQQTASTGVGNVPASTARTVSFPLWHLLQVHNTQYVYLMGLPANEI